MKGAPPTPNVVRVSPSGCAAERRARADGSRVLRRHAGPSAFERVEPDAGTSGGFARRAGARNTKAAVLAIEAVLAIDRAMAGGAEHVRDVGAAERQVALQACHAFAVARARSARACSRDALPTDAVGSRETRVRVISETELIEREGDDAILVEADGGDAEAVVSRGDAAARQAIGALRCSTALRRVVFAQPQLSGLQRSP